MKQKFYVSGMTCSACSSFIEKTISELAGTTECSVSLVTNTMIVDYDEALCNGEIIIKKVSSIGYQASLDKPSFSKTNENKKNDIKKLKLYLSLFLLIILMYISMGPMFGVPIPKFLTFPDYDNLASSFYLGICSLVLVIPIIILNFGYFSRGFKHLIKKNPNMDTLIALGAAASLIYGLVTIWFSYRGWQNSDLELVQKMYKGYYFESAGSILTFVSIGKYLESLSKKKTTAAIEKLIALTPNEVLVKKGNDLIEKSIEDVQIGEYIMVKPGQQVPLDGIIVEGETSINSASLTGESLPQYKKKQDVVLAGTQNINGTIIIEVTHTYIDSSIAKIIKLVEEASNSKMPISRLVDKVARIFVPAVMIIAVITGIVWLFIDYNQLFTHTISVLVISCPCALGLATPLAIMVASGSSAREGILIRNSICLEVLKDVKTVVFDKTGTLTKGLMIVKEIKNVNGDYQKFIDLAYAMEKNSTHPLACSLCEKIKTTIKNDYLFDSIQELPGLGMVCRQGDNVYYAGNSKLLKAHQVLIPDGGDDTKIMIAENEELLGIITFTDEIKTQSYELINALKKLKIETILLSGDNNQVVKKLQDELGIDKAFGEAMPEDKKNIIENLKTHNKVLMVGDGINDAIALTAADVGIAIGDGTDIAIDSADIVIIGEDLTRIVDIINLSKKTINTIKLNLFWAFFYNAICIPIASGVLVPLGIVISPMVGSLMMSLSSICVVLNSLRLRKFKIKNDNYEDKEKKNMQKALKIEGMMCKHCQKHVEDALYAIEGVSIVEVSLDEKQAVVSMTKEITDELLIDAVVKAGYDVLSVK